jgi:serine/threonine protein kinase
MLQSLQILRDRYQLQKRLGHNAGRQTWLALDTKTQSPVVVKLLTFTDQVQWDQIRLFEREAKILKHLDHAQIPQYLDCFCLKDRQIWGGLVQTYVPAPSLQHLLNQKRRFYVSEVRQIAKQMLNLLIYLHGLSPPILHRDIKPSNLLLNERGTIYLVDFGAVQDGVAKAGATFTIVGTYGYAPLEQLGGQATPASDLYALGATLIHLLTGIAPAQFRQTNGRLQFAAGLHLNPGLVHWLWRLTAMNVQDRFTTAREALAALEAHEQAISATVTDRPAKSKIKIKVERSPKHLKISFPDTGRCFDFDTQHFKIADYRVFGISFGMRQGEIADIEDVSEDLIVQYRGDSLSALKITVGVDEYLFKCADDRLRYWLIKTIRQWLGMEYVATYSLLILRLLEARASEWLGIEDFETCSLILRQLEAEASEWLGIEDDF